MDWKGKIPTCEDSNLSMFVQMGMFLQIIPSKTKCYWRDELISPRLCPDIDHVIKANSEPLGNVLIISPYCKIGDELKNKLKSLGLAFVYFPPELSYYCPGKSHTYVIYDEKVLD